MNRTLKILLLSDIFLLTGFGLISPILAIFIKENLVGGTIFAAGLSVFIFWTTKSVVQLPLSKYVDKHDHRISLLIAGTFIMALVPFAYIFINHVNFIYLVQALYGIGSGLAYPCWIGLWSTNLEKHHESFEWSVYSTFAGLSVAFAAAIGGLLAETMGFNFTFAIVGISALVGGFVLFNLEKKAEKKRKTDIIAHHRKRKLAPKHSKID